jgi:hypothetical protein
MDSCPDTSIVHYFKDLKDLRIKRAKKHRLIDIMVIALGSVRAIANGPMLTKANSSVLA